MKIVNDTITFETTGREEYANRGIVGLDSTLKPSEGFDGAFSHEEWTPEEKLEMAEFMIEQWARFGGLVSLWSQRQERPDEKCTCGRVLHIRKSCAVCDRDE